ncbi:MAG: hypothetical protein LBG90_07270 [Spirochaetaceae bacterium]|nr:hypothetical protein [Spirochaetaceae bacterium]
MKKFSQVDKAGQLNDLLGDIIGAWAFMYGRVNKLIWPAGYLEKAIAEIAAESSPQLVILYDLTAHASFAFNEDGSFNTGADLLLPQFYPGTHRYAAKKILGYIDAILSWDRNAVIVVEADHGLHVEKTRQAFLAEGKTDDDIRLAQNQTLSAVRIPKEWGGLESPLDPLNISRELVNRYVGKNYRLLTEHP